MEIGATLRLQLVDVAWTMCPYSLDRVVPWGRTAEEYQAMFSTSFSGVATGCCACGKIRGLCSKVPKPCKLLLDTRL